jgi:cell division septation protein DedD
VPRDRQSLVRDDCDHRHYITISALVLFLPKCYYLRALAADTPDDGFHEIQLNGKQLVFLFMAATVVSVVIFLCGVLVGRGVRAERAATSADAGAATIEPTPQAAAPTPATPPAGSDPTTAAPPPTVDDLSYFNRLEKQTPAVEELKAPPAAAPNVVAAIASPKSPPPIATPPAASQPAPSPGDGYAIQVAAMLDHTDADAMAKRLSSKGYNAFILPLGQTTPTRYRVRVGKFKTKHEAEVAAARLQKEEQFKPWITR